MGIECPHCGKGTATNSRWHYLGADQDGEWALKWFTCQLPECARHVVYLVRGLSLIFGASDNSVLSGFQEVHEELLLYPKIPFARQPASTVPVELAQDFREAAQVLSISPRSSAALSRRCLQHLLRSHLGIRHATLKEEIDELLSKKDLPPYLHKSVDAVRHYGNLAAHPEASINSGVIVNVEQGEADWLLEVLEGLFEHCFILPEQYQQKRDALNAKLVELGKLPMR